MLQVIPRIEYPICPAAQLGVYVGAVSQSYERTGDSSASLTLGADCSAKIIPRRTPRAIILGSHRFGLEVEEHVEFTVTADLNEEAGVIDNPVRAGRIKVAAEALFGHLAENCVVCPAKNYCGQREILAVIAQNPAQAIGEDLI